MGSLTESEAVMLVWLSRFLLLVSLRTSFFFRRGDFLSFN
ncbi:hypothetical protein PORCRE_320 [Porphyromonas crevioricanis JCM 15906]|uniref:Uncharacterized protein n=1 Tax=Porphyromonas crevioricanis JCM 15906 TaxID=1305617 RepID=T1DQA2_9PORP|nr:hypothetical protein PORCRE_320 [Porphyromonas crevioricanis JCM 15906]